MRAICKLMLIVCVGVAALYQSGCSGVAVADVTLSGAKFDANTSSMDLGNVAVGDTKTASITFTNSLNSTVTILNISVSGPGFNASGIPSGTIVNTGQTVTLNVTFTASGTGTQTGSITLTNNSQTATITVGLQATGVPAGDHLANLTWISGGGTPIGYNVYRGTVSGGPYTRLNAAVDASTNYIDSVVSPGQQYFYVVTAIGPDSIESGYSDEVAARIPSP